MYTKGDWKVIKDKENRTHIMGFDNGFERNICVLSVRSPEEEEANAHRIVDCVNGCKDIENPLAVKELYEELKEALAEICRLCVRLNPQHKYCESCLEMEERQKPILKAGVKIMPKVKHDQRHKGEPCSYNEDINCQEDTCLNCSTFEKYILSIP